MGSCGSSNEVAEVTPNAKQPSRAPSARPKDEPSASADANLKYENNTNDESKEDKRPPSANPHWLVKPAEPAELN